ncbi:MAG TPA: ImcF-related family protein [Bryobacteraceae bacterium]|nr:ImcF-related family protein [Bryobacteraceae bacterium]
MKLSRTAWTVIAVLILVVWLILTWFLGDWLHLHSPVIWFLRGGLWLIGIAGFIGYVVLRPKDGDAAQDAAAGNPDIDFAFNEASKRMRAARGIKQLGSMPAIFVLGEQASAKTSVIAKSGLEPELLAGHAYDDYVVAPTRALNLWFARNALLIDPAGGIVGDAPSRRKLFRKFLPVRLNAVLASSLPPSRSVVFTVDCEIFLQAGAAEALAAKARQFQGVLTELAQILGSSFPVYVLFTKADKIGYFRDYVDALTEPEAADVFGSTLPMEAQHAQGVYGEQQNRRITEAFQELYRSLCDKRPTYLAREPDATKLPNVYEFPREFGKLRNLLVQFLVDLCRPSQLGTSPFLRGFYFTGVRPVTVTDLAPASAQVAAREETPIDAGATRIFNPRMQGAPLAEAHAPQIGSRKVPQWVFLGHLFSDVILADRPASSVTQSNVKINVARRILFGAAAALVLLMAAWWVVSFNNNNDLVHGAINDAQTVQADNLPAGQLASAGSLQHLTNVKRTLAQLKSYDKNGVPMSFGAFLYAGNSIREPLRTVYFALFRKLLLAPTQNNLVQICGKPDASGNPDYVYDSLKSYLITTQYSNKVSSMPTLATVLLDRWQKGQATTKTQQDLALENFQFYVEDLPQGNPYSDATRPNENAVFTAREYLKNYNQEKHIYQLMLADAGRGQKTIIFNQDYPDSKGIIINGYPVDPAFSKSGSDNFTKELGDPKRYFSGEEWVLGPSAAPPKSAKELKDDFSAMYSKDMIQRWQGYLNATSVAPYKDLNDAVEKLDRMGGGQSPLMRVLCVASDNTSKITEAKAAFQPLEVVTPPGCLDQPMGANASSYLASLITLKGTLQQIASQQPPDPNAAKTVTPIAIQAEGEVTKLSGTFRPDSPVFQKTAQLLKDPITRVNEVLAGNVVDAINSGAGEACKAMSPMLSKYPFNPSSKAEASLDEVNQALNPQSSKLWQFVNGDEMKKFVTLNGADYVANPAQSKPVVTAAYLRFLNRAKHLTDAMYKGGPKPDLSFSVKPLPAPDLDHITLTIDGTTLSTDPKQGTSKTFSWPGTTSNAVLLVRFGGASVDSSLSDNTGLWAIWHLLDTAQKLSVAGNQYQVQWVLSTTAGPVIINSHPATAPFVLDAQGSQIFSRGFLSGLGCVSKAVQ